MSPARRPVVAVLRAPDDTRTFAEVEAAAEVRYATADTLADALDGADVLLMWDFFSGALPQAWQNAGSLRWIHMAAAGVDTLLFDELTASDVVVTNARGIFDRPIAEFVLGAVLAFAKDAPRSLRLQQQHRWQWRESERIDGARALIVGTGAIGREIARLLRAVGMRVSGAGRTAREDADFGTVHASSALGGPDAAAILGDVDYLIAVAPLTDKTRGMIDAHVLDALPDRARLINVGRGELVVTDDLVAALRAGTEENPGPTSGSRGPGGIAGAALDVVDPEPLPGDHPLWSMPTAIITPHMAGDAAGWRDRLAELFTDAFTQYTNGTAPSKLPNVVDKQSGFVTRSTS